LAVLHAMPLFAASAPLGSCWHLRLAAGSRGCQLIEVDRKSSAYPQNDANDPKRTLRFQGVAGGTGERPRRPWPLRSVTGQSVGKTLAAQ